MPGLDELLMAQIPTIRYPPRRVLGMLSTTFLWLLRGVSRNNIESWVTILAFPKLMLARYHGKPEVVFGRRAELWAAGQFRTLFEENLAHATEQAASRPAHSQGIPLIDDDLLPPHLRFDTGVSLEDIPVEAIRRASSLASDEQLSRAMAALGAAKIAPKTPDVFEKLLAKHPRALRPTVIAQPATPQEDLHHSARDVRAAIFAFARGSAPGPSGLRPDTLKSFAVKGGPDMLQALGRVFDMIGTRDCIPGEVRRWFFGALLIAFWKVGDDIRPIACGETLRRGGARKPVKAGVQQARAALLEVGHVGVGVRGGSEAACTAMRRRCNKAIAEEDKAYCNTVLDKSNAYGNLDRTFMGEAIAEDAPAASGYASNAYALPSCLIFGDSIILSERGPHQGDPGGSLFYSLSERRIVRATPNASIVGKIFYQDDGSVSGLRTDVSAFVAALERSSAPAGLSFNRRKCTVYSLDPEADRAAFPDFRTRPLQELTFLGVPCGTQEQAELFVEAALAKATKKMERIQALPRHAGYLLLRSCAAFSVGGFYARNAGPCPALERYDAAVRRVFGEVACMTTDAAWAQCQLPLRLGGLGFRSSAKHAALAHCAMQASIRPLLSSAFPDVTTPSMIAHDPLLCTSLAEVHALFPSLENEVLEALGADAPAGKLQKKWSACIDEADWTRLTEEGDDFTKARLQSLRSKYASSWLQSLSDLEPLQHLSNEQFTAAVRLRLGLQLWRGPTPQEGGNYCACGALTDPMGDHAMRCTYGSHRIALHNDVRNEIHFLAQVRFPGNAHIEERPFSTQNHTGSRLDVTVVRHGAGHDLLDIAVIHPHLSIAKARTAASGPGAACTEYEQRKRDKYGEAVAAENRLTGRNMTLAPVIFDCYGAMGATAQDVLPRLVRKAGELFTSNPAAATGCGMQRVIARLMKGVATLVLRHDPHI